MSRAASEPSTRGKTPVAVLVILAGVAFGASISFGAYALASVPVIMVAVAVLSRGRVVPYAVLIVAVCSAVYVYAYPMASLGSFGLPLAHVLLAVCLLGSFLFIARNGLGLEIADGRDIALAGVLGVLAVAGIMVAYTRGIDLKRAVWETRNVLFYLALVPATAALATVRGRKSVITLVVAVAVAVAVLQVLQAVVGAGTPLFVTGESTNLLLVDAASAFVRVRGPGLVLVYIVAAFAVSAAFWGPRRLRVKALLVLAVCLSGVLVSLNRNMVLGLAAGVIVAFLFARRRGRGLVIGMAVCALALLGVLAFGDSASNPITARIVSLTDYSGLVDSTLAERYYENGRALDALTKSPVFGVGWGSSYGARMDRTLDMWGRLAPRGWIHNQYLEVWLRMGVVGLACVLVLLLRALLAGVSWSRRSEAADDGWLGLGIVISVVAMAASATVGMYFTSPDSVIPFCGVLALAFVLRNTKTQQLEQGAAQ